ncbi:MAG: hypothetical protein U5K77_01595 [Candidatus Saccharibacteria bacterium]|nr:hypothetical protein [Candidatus Saccharibacteria bacterium]
MSAEKSPAELAVDELAAGAKTPDEVATVEAWREEVAQDRAAGSGAQPLPWS